MFAYFISGKEDDAIFTHVNLKDDGKLTLYYYKSWFKNDTDSLPIIQKWIQNTKNAVIKSKKKHIKENTFSYRRCGKIYIRKVLLDNLLGDRYTKELCHIISGTISVYISIRNKIVEISCDISEKDIKPLLSGLKNHPSFSKDPNKESLNSNLIFFDFDLLSSERSYFVANKLNLNNLKPSIFQKPNDNNLFEEKMGYGIRFLSGGECSGPDVEQKSKTTSTRSETERIPDSRSIDISAKDSNGADAENIG
jgi:hypothetical protein